VVQCSFISHKRLSKDRVSNSWRRVLDGWYWPTFSNDKGVGIISRLSLKIFDFTLSQKQTFKVSREHYRSQHHVVVELSLNNTRGYGEAVAFSVYGATVEGLHNAIESVRDIIENHQYHTPDLFWNECISPIKTSSFAQCALDVASHDLYGKLRSQTTAELLGIDTSKPCFSLISIGMDDLDTIAKKSKKLSHWPILKLKLGDDLDLERVKIVRQNSAAIIHVDANAGWSVKKTLNMAPKLADLGVKSIEQPLPVEDWDEAQYLCEQCPLPIIADESCFDEASFNRCLEIYNGVNIKLMKAGGITPGFKQINRAKEKGVGVSIGCMPESSIGASAIAHLAPLVDYVDMDSIEFLEKDLATGIFLEKGSICYNHLPGLGFTCLF